MIIYAQVVEFGTFSSVSQERTKKKSGSAEFFFFIHFSIYKYMYITKVKLSFFRMLITKNCTNFNHKMMKIDII